MRRHSKRSKAAPGIGGGEVTEQTERERREKKEEKKKKKTTELGSPCGTGRIPLRGDKDAK